MIAGRIAVSPAATRRVIGALDQRLISVARDGLERAGQELGEVRRGRGALNGYKRRGQHEGNDEARLNFAR